MAHDPSSRFVCYKIGQDSTTAVLGIVCILCSFYETIGFLHYSTYTANIVERGNKGGMARVVPALVAGKVVAPAETEHQVYTNYIS